MMNDALIEGDNGYIKIPDFFKAKTCSLHNHAGEIEEFVDSSEGVGYCHEINAINQNLLDGKKQSEIMPWHVSLMIQEIMDINQSKLS